MAKNAHPHFISSELTTDGPIVRVTTTAAGAQANGDSFIPIGISGFSADGTKVYFESTASNLVAGDTNGGMDVFVKDLTTGAVTRLSTTSSGGEANGSSGPFALSADGTKLVFASSATNLVAGDTNGTADVFVKDLTTGTVTRVSTASDGTQADSFSTAASFSPDGNAVIFRSAAGNLTPGGITGNDQIYVKNLMTGQLTLISDFPGTSNTGEDGHFSPDGGKVVYSVLYHDQAHIDSGDGGDIFVKDLTTGAVTRISSAPGGADSNGYSYGAQYTADGSKILFNSSASNLVAGDTNGATDVFAYDVATGAITRVSTDANGNQLSKGAADFSLSPDGTEALFFTQTPGLAPGDTVPNSQNAFVVDLATGQIAQVDTTATGQQANDASYGVTFAPDGHSILLQSLASNLVAGDTNNAIDLFIKPLTTDVATTTGMVIGFTHETSGQLLFTDNDLADTHVVSVNNPSHSIGTFTVTLDKDTTGTGTGGRIGWDYNVDPATLRALGQGESRTQTYTVHLTDGHVIIDQAVTITLVGVNDAPELTGTQAVMPDGQQGHPYLFTDAQLLAGFTDPDGDALSVSSLSVSGSGATLVINGDGTYSLNEPAAFTGPITLSYMVKDTHGAMTAATETFNIVAPTAPPQMIQGTNNAETLMGDSGNDTIKGLGGDDHLWGLDGNDSLVGGAGADTLYGGHGDDTYMVDSLSDIVSEESTGAGIDDGGNDRVFSTVDYTLGAFIEALNLDGSGNISGTGNGLQNNIYGNGGNNVLSGMGGNDKLRGGAGDDTLIGGTGNDILEGDAGADHFVFAAAGAANGVDRISDFEHGIDWLVFSTADYDASAAFTAGSAAVGAGAQFVWNSTTGTLWYDHDGAGGGAAIAIATFTNAPTLDASDLHFV